jgi:uncharacterized membrane protein (UPF0127 family)
MLSRVVVADTGRIVAEHMRHAVSVRERMRGLRAHQRLAQGEALLLTPCKQVHTFGMRFPIDVVFCDPDWRVVLVARGMLPVRVGRLVGRARHAVELAAGAAADVRVGDHLRIEPRS